MDISKKSKFWMVYVEGRSSPKVAHSTYSEALAEAKRLCVREVQQTYVLESLTVLTPQPPEVEHLIFVSTGNRE